MDGKGRRIIASVISFFIYLAGSVLLLYSLYSENGKAFLITLCAIPLCLVIYCGIYSFLLTSKDTQMRPTSALVTFALPYAALGILFFITSLILKEDYAFDLAVYLIFFVIIAAISFSASKFAIAAAERKSYNARVSEVKNRERN